MTDDEAVPGPNELPTAAGPGEFITYEPLGMIPAEPGWRALFVDEKNSSTAEVPVIAWGIFRQTRRRVRDFRPLGDVSNCIDGIIGDMTYLGADRYLDCARADSRFRGYIEPGVAANAG